MSTRSGQLLRCLTLAIAIQVLVGLVLVTVTLLRTDQDVSITTIGLSPREAPTKQNKGGIEAPKSLESNVPMSTNNSISITSNAPKSIDKPAPETSRPEMSTKAKPDLSKEEPIWILHWAGGSGKGSPQCDVPCFCTSEKSDEALKRAAAVVFSIPSYGGNPRSAMNGRATQALTVGLSMESAEYYSRQKDLSDYDLTATTSFDSDFPLTYYEWGYDLLKDVSSWPWEKREPAIVFVARNCNSRDRRETLVKWLQKYVRVDSVSSCLHNHDWPADIPRSNKNDLQMRYMLYLAAENSVEKDYVTEKVYGGLINGAIPIYLGAPNIKEFVPSHSVIPVPQDFSEADVVKISETVKEIFRNKTVYEEWIEYKKHPYEEHFKRKFHIAHTHIWCRVCRRIYAMKHGYGWDKERQEIIFN